MMPGKCEIGMKETVKMTRWTNDEVNRAWIMCNGQCALLCVSCRQWMLLLLPIFFLMMMMMTRDAAAVVAVTMNKKDCCVGTAEDEDPRTFINTKGQFISFQLHRVFSGLCTYL